MVQLKPWVHIEILADLAITAARYSTNTEDVFFGVFGWRQLVEVGLRLVFAAYFALPQHRAVHYHVAIADRFHVLVAVQT